MMKPTWQELAVLPIAVILIGGFLLFIFLTKPEQIITEAPNPDFAAIKDVKLKKQTYFDFMLPIIRRANEGVKFERRKVLEIAQRLDSDKDLSGAQKQTLAALALRYRVKAEKLADQQIANELLDRVDVIPESLVLAQSANESAWGTARFARQGNNYFGLWCWSKNCGMVPTGRTEGATHEVASFQTVQDGIDYYLLTLNSHPAYTSLRKERAILRGNQQPITGWALAGGLLAYSERREAYVAEIREMITYNKLE